MKKSKDEEPASIVLSSRPVPTTRPVGSGYHPNTLRSTSYPTSRLSANFVPVDQAEVLLEISKKLGAVTTGKLSVIVEQIKHLQTIARSIISEAEKNMELHNVVCSFQKRHGHTYYLYERPETGPYFSMLSPEDWGNPPHRFLGAYRLEEDETWSEVTEQP